MASPNGSFAAQGYAEAESSESGERAASLESGGGRNQEAE